MSAPSAHELWAAEQKAAQWAKWAPIWYVFSVIVDLLVAWAESSRFREILHTLRVQLDTGEVRRQNNPAAINALGFVPLLVAAPFYVPFLIWQFRAAKTARLLGLPSTLSPGLGVGGWLIPIVNLWFPYQAIRDCLPGDDPGRAVVSRLWMFFIMALVAHVATSISTFVGSPIGFVFAAITVAMATGFALNAVRAVRLIAETHQRLLFPNQIDR